MAEKNIYNKELGRYQTQDEWDAFIKENRDRRRESTERLNTYGSDLNYTWNEEKGWNELDTSSFGEWDSYKDIYDQILSFENGLRGWDALEDNAKQWYLNRGFDPTADRSKGRYQTLEEYNKFVQDNIDRRKAATDRMNRYGSELDYYWDDEKGWNRLDTSSFGDWNSYKDIYSDILNFESGLKGWSILAPEAQEWYLSKFKPEDIIAEVDEATGETKTVLDLINVEKTITDPVDTIPGEPVDTSTIEIDYNINEGSDPAINIPKYTYEIAGRGNVDPNNPNNYGRILDLSSLYNNVGPYNNVNNQTTNTNGWFYNSQTGRWEQPQNNNAGGMIRQNYNDAGEVEPEKFLKSDFTLAATDTNAGINPALSNALWNTANWYQTDEQGGVPAWYGTKFVGDELEQVNDQNETQAEFDARVAANNVGKSPGDPGYIDPNSFQALSPVAGFNQSQLLGQNALLDAAGGYSYQDPNTGETKFQPGQIDIGETLANATQTGLGGGYSYDPATQTAATLADVQGYNASQVDLDSINRNEIASINPALRDQSNYLNQYLNPAVQQAQQQAIANVNSSFGQGGTLGGARNVRSGVTAATQAALPVLTQGANTQFQADQAIDAANQQFFNAAETANAAAANQASAQNQQAQLQAALANAGAQNAAATFGATAQNQANQLNQAALNQADAANAAAANQAQQFNLNNISNWANQIPTAQNALRAGGDLIQEIGQQKQDLAQTQANQDVQAWNYNQTIPQQQLFNQLGLAQIAQAAQNAGIKYDLGNAASGGGFDLGGALQQGLISGLSGGVESLLGGLFSNSGGMVPNYNQGGLLDDTMDTTGIIPVGRRNVMTRRA